MDEEDFNSNSLLDWKEKERSKINLRCLAWGTVSVVAPLTRKENTGRESHVTKGKLFFYYVDFKGEME